MIQVLILLLFCCLGEKNDARAFSRNAPLSHSGVKRMHSTQHHTELFMVSNRKKSKKKKKPSATTKGFGPPPLTLSEVASKFETRLPSNPDESPCPCGSGNPYGSCCGVYHRGDDLPPTPMELLKSRYTAFAFRLPLYIIETTHPTNDDYREDKMAWIKDLNKSGMFDSYKFVGLEYVGDIEHGDSSKKEEAYISFKVRLRNKDDDGEEEKVIEERSHFLKDGDPAKWRYASS